MKKTIFSLGLLAISFVGHTQLSSEVSREDFAQLLTDSKISAKWSSVQKLNTKAEVRIEDQQAVYQSYIQALRNSDLYLNDALKAIIELEIVAAENKLKTLTN